MNYSDVVGAIISVNLLAEPNFCPINGKIHHILIDSPVMDMSKNTLPVFLKKGIANSFDLEVCMFVSINCEQHNEMSLFNTFPSV